MVSPSSLMFLNALMIAVFVWVIGGLSEPAPFPPAEASSPPSLSAERGARGSSHLVVRHIEMPATRWVTEDPEPLEESHEGTVEETVEGTVEGEAPGGEGPRAEVEPDAGVEVATSPLPGEASPVVGPESPEPEPGTLSPPHEPDPEQVLARAEALAERAAPVAPIRIAPPPASPVAPEVEEEDEELDREMRERATRDDPVEEVVEAPEVAEAEDAGEPVAREAAAELAGSARLATAPEAAAVVASAPEGPAVAPVPPAPVEVAEAAPVPEVTVPAGEPEVLTGPTTMEVYRQRVRAAAEKIDAGELRAGIAELDAVLELEDVIGERRAWALYQQARAWRRLGHHARAIRLYGEAIDNDPPGTLYKNSLAWLLATTPDVHLKDPEAAVGLAQEAVREGGERANYLDTLARAHFAAGQLAEAIAVQGRAVARWPERQSFRNRLSWYQQELVARGGAVLAGAP